MPQNKKNLPIIVKFKRQSQTVFVTATPRETFGVLVTRLVDTINKTGGLKLENEPIGLDNEDDDGNEDLELPDIDIPKPSFETASSDEEQQNSDEKDTDAGNIQLVAEKLKFALPTDPSDIYQGGFEDMDCKTSDKMSNLALTDYSVIAFALKDEDFRICQPTIDEDEDGE